MRHFKIVYIILKYYIYWDQSPAHEFHLSTESIVLFLFKVMISLYDFGVGIIVVVIFWTKLSLSKESRGLTDSFIIARVDGINSPIFMFLSKCAGYTKMFSSNVQYFIVQRIIQCRGKIWSFISEVWSSDTISE